MSDAIPVKVDTEVLAELEKEADRVMHQDVPRTHAITWLWGEYKALRRRVAQLERQQAAVTEAQTPIAA